MAATLVRFFRKLDNFIYQKWNDGQTMAVRDQIFKGNLILHVRSKKFQFCLFNYMMMHINQWLLFDYKNISKTVHLKHEKIIFQILTLFFFMIAVFNKWWWWLLMLKFELFELLQIDFNMIIVIMNNFIFWLINDAPKTVQFEIFYCWNNKLFKWSKMMIKCEIHMIQLKFNVCNDL